MATKNAFIVRPGMKMFIVQGTHHFVPGTPLSLHLTPEGADAAALELLNLIRKDLELPPADRYTPEAINEAKKKIDEDHGGTEACDVWIDAVEVQQ